MDLLNPDNLCGQTLLRIVSRGSAIIAEELRLADNIPEVFLGADKIQDPSQLKYQAILFDCEYLRDPEAYENKINESQDLIELEKSLSNAVLPDILERTKIALNFNEQLKNEILITI